MAVGTTTVVAAYTDAAAADAGTKYGFLVDLACELNAHLQHLQDIKIGE